jgi:uncharacterized membrane protein (DUF2068 family)
MERPAGVTVLACFYFLAVFVLLVTLIPSAQAGAFNPLNPRFIAFEIGNLTLAITTGIGLLTMKGWSRWLAIIYAAASLVMSIRQLAVDPPWRHGVPVFTSLVAVVLRMLFCVWAIWYLARARIKMAFQGAGSRLPVSPVHTN